MIKKELIRKNSSVYEIDENFKRIDEISNNRNLEIHNLIGICEDIVSTWSILKEYAKEIYNDEKGNHTYAQQYMYQVYISKKGNPFLFLFLLI